MKYIIHFIIKCCLYYVLYILCFAVWLYHALYLFNHKAGVKEAKEVYNEIEKSFLDYI